MENSTQIVTGELSNSRREFLEKAGFGLVFGTLGVSFFTSCSSTEDADPAPKTPGGNTGNPGPGTGISVSGNTITIDLTIQTGLAASGGWLLISSARTLVVNVSGSYNAMTSICTHEGCFDSWTFSGSRFTCNCHGSVFDSSGKLLNGPATQHLDQYAATAAGTTLTIVR
ncbi:Rieske (2Fe-2S) protein [Algoriphagus jejuensis]|uniref:ubiquinol-cytochrome c reductase iron-sulfur subunit n=1 Tax=Algoriphagus jejuensis TaxID=419934 RepID=UPI0031D76936